jgi:hypothetical protein
LEPRHGGQVRLANLCRAYEGDGWIVIPVCIYPEEGYNVSHDAAIPFPKKSPFRLFGARKVPFIVDLLTGDFAASEAGAWPRLLSLLPTTLDAIHVEQPWLWPVAEKIRALPAYHRTALIYGAANIEEALKRKILEPYRSDDTERALRAVDALERHASAIADLVLAVTDDEMTTLQSWGAAHVVMAANGIARWEASAEDLAEWKSRLPEAPWLLYVASAHPPNYTGFADLIGQSLACIPPDSRLVVAGGVAERIEEVLRSSKWPSLNLSRLAVLGILNDRDLNAVRSLAHGYFLPVAYGAGSNIKTAEALLSGKYVIGTSVAFRGFEAYSTLPRVRVADHPSSVQRAIRDILTLPPLSTKAGVDPALNHLTWEYTLRNVPIEVGAAAIRRAASAGG